MLFLRLRRAVGLAQSSNEMTLKVWILHAMALIFEKDLRPYGSSAEVPRCFGIVGRVNNDLQPETLDFIYSSLLQADEDWRYSRGSIGRIEELTTISELRSLLEAYPLLSVVAMTAGLTWGQVVFRVCLSCSSHVCNISTSGSIAISPKSRILLSSSF